MADQHSNNKLIAKNTLLLYGRMLLAMFVALFTSRVVLNTLGVEDYGIYGVVGGVVSLFGFLNSSLSAATSRFITFEMGRGNRDKLKMTFNSAFLVHLAIAVVILIFAETIGLWFLTHKMVIPDGRMTAAFWVFQLSVIDMAIGVTQVPYSATIVSHERMDIYAYVELSNIFLRLLAVYLLVIGNFDKLILYSILITSISIGSALYYRYFCVKHFLECHINCIVDRSLLKRMLVFSGWDLFGNLSVTAREQGIGMLINMFFGVTINAACSIAGQVQGAVMAFATNILMAVRPQITKSYAAEDYERSALLIKYTAILVFYLLCTLTLPLIVEMRYVLHLWLGIVPDWSVCFCIFSLLYNVVVSLSMLMLTIPHAAEKNKYPSLVNGSMYILALPISYFVYKYFRLVWFASLYNVITIFLAFVFMTWLTSRYLKVFSFTKFLIGVILKNGCVILVIVAFLFYIKSLLAVSLVRFILITVFSTVLVLSSGLYIGLNKEMRIYVYAYIRKKIHSWRK